MSHAQRNLVFNISVRAAGAGPRHYLMRTSGAFRLGDNDEASVSSCCWCGTARWVAPLPRCAADPHATENRIRRRFARPHSQGGGHCARGILWCACYIRCVPCRTLQGARPHCYAKRGKNCLRLPRGAARRVRSCRDEPSLRDLRPLSSTRSAAAACEVSHPHRPLLSQA